MAFRRATLSYNTYLPQQPIQGTLHCRDGKCTRSLDSAWQGGLPPPASDGSTRTLTMVPDPLASCCRARTAFVMFTLRLPRGLLMVPSFLLAPAHLWPAHCWAHYVMGACSSPLLNTVVLGICDFMAKVKP